MSIHSYLQSPGHLSSGPCARCWRHLAPYLPKVPRWSRDHGRARSLVCNLCWEGPMLSLWLCSHYLEILHFSTRGPHFHFELGPATYVVGPAFLMKCLGQTFQTWAFTSQFRPLPPSREVCFFHCFQQIVLSNVITDAINGSFFLAVKLCTSNTGFQSFFEMISSLSCHDRWLLPLLDLMWFFFFGLTLPAFPLGPAPHLEVPSKTEQSMVELFLCKLVYSHTSYLSHLLCGMHMKMDFHHTSITVSNLTTIWTWFTLIFPTSFFFSTCLLHNSSNFWPLLLYSTNSHGIPWFYLF